MGQYPSTSIMPYRLTNIVQSQMAGAVADKVITDPVLKAYARGPAVVPKPQEQPLDEFSKEELKQMLLAARAHVRAVRKIRRWVTRMAEAYQSGELADPDAHYLGQLLSMVVQGEHIASQPRNKRVYALRDLFPAEAWTLYQPRQGGYVSVVQWCYRAALPSLVDLFPYRILLLAGTGVAVDEITALNVSDIECVEDGVRLQMTKSRAGRSKGRFFPGSTEGGGWDIPSVVQSLLDFTEPARAITAPQWNGRLWLTTRLNGRAANEERYRPVPADFGGFGLTSWIEAVQGIFDVGEISPPHDMRRIRKSKVTKRAIDLRGAMADIAGDDHTTKVFFSHYAHTTTLKVYSAAVISTFQSTLIDAVKTGFTAFLEPRSEVPAAALTEALPIDSTHADSLRSGALDMGVVDCQDPFDSPFTKKGKLCGAAPLSCLMCDNAVVFTDHLPSILALVAAMEAAKTSLAPDEWIATWGAQYDAAQALIAALPDSVREEAERTKPSATTDLPAWLRQGAK